MHLSCSKERCVPHSLCVLACAQACAVGFCLFVRQVHIFVKTLFVIITRDVFVSAIKSLIHRVCVCVCARLSTPHYDREGEWSGWISVQAAGDERGGRGYLYADPKINVSVCVCLHPCDSL